ncbi:hypothetical protein BDU57DRAFT_548316 [Ampelomyces quisqualis]|uniref:C2H2-type domain-containing protein n=1 Tax=Ampelomyces quisqualis TaxID=50730 RepID=A0A6A5QQ38_AMPQU|nr:hypothetical protein BDU57DRAFT_548316 [Ampelomyces quisqualis]
MTKKRKRYPDLNQKLERPWCYYCERDFDDLKILISHQKAKHFKCDRCGRRLNTAGGLSVHMNQVHKENLTHVENANPGRQGLEIEIFGMEGVPAEIIDQHNQQVTQAHFQEEQERARLTGNPVRGEFTNGTAPPNKRKKVNETLEEIQARAEQYREDRKNGILPVQPMDVVDPTPPASIAQQQQQFYPPPPFSHSSSAAPNGSALPPRSHAVDAIQSSIDDLIAGAAKEAPPAAEKKEKSKKDKNMRLIFNDDHFSPEEKMARLDKYVQYVRV